MPNRIVRDGILTSTRVDQLDDAAEVFYRRLMSVVDDFGRFFADPVLLHTGCYPRRPEKYDRDLIASLIAQCRGARLLTTYSVEGTEYLELIDFNQRIREKQRSKFPDPPAAEISREPLKFPAKSGEPQEKSAYARATNTPTTTKETPTTTASPPKREVSEVWKRAGFVDFEDFADWYEKFYDQHPTRSDKGIGKDYFRDVFVSGKADRATVESVYEQYKKHDPQWLRGVIPGLPKLIRDEFWKHPPRELPSPVQRGKGMSVEEIASL